jgi:formylglycine-generating enzyme required for sulfatase activity
MRMNTGPWEWCDDWFMRDAYRRLPAANPNTKYLPIDTVPAHGECLERRRVIRGGLDMYRFYYPYANRWSHMPNCAHSDFGVRCVLPIPLELRRQAEHIGEQGTAADADKPRR